ncbi:DUF3078 domain-containing protein [Muricauda sp. DJ-13]|uniref:DUF3078 domain-containing protein n=1 Tax=Croceivirga thetidis TaxID=2721623 RepID=A0ABX1GPN1_9FLAO|nr:DUF3078 domain-containing protein [Croceivirga thetidis]
MLKLFFLSAFLNLSPTSLFAQIQERDSVFDQTNATQTDTIVIRWPQKKAKIVSRGLKDLTPEVLLVKPKTLVKKYKKITPFSLWESQNQFSLNINEVAFVNWNAGGENSISGLANLNLARNYKFGNITWANELRLRYGINIQEGQGLRKTDDFIKFSSVFGYRKDSVTPWYASAKLNFNTQFSDGFRFPEEIPISRFMAPGYLFLGGGVTFEPKDKKFILYVSPLTQKSTFVLDETLSNQGAFGVQRGEKTFTELGFLVTNSWEKEILKNILMNHRLTLYTDYIRSFGNVDFDWEMNFTLKVNQYVNANIGTHLIYDDDIKFDEVVAEDGTVTTPGTPRIQFKQLLGVGFVYKF